MDLSASCKSPDMLPKRLRGVSGRLQQDVSHDKKHVHGRHTIIQEHERCMKVEIYAEAYRKSKSLLGSYHDARRMHESLDMRPPAHSVIENLTHFNR